MYMDMRIFCEEMQENKIIVSSHVKEEMHRKSYECLLEYHITLNFSMSKPMMF